MEAEEAASDEKEAAKDIADAQARSALSAQLLAEQNTIVKEATADSTFYARQAAKLKTPEARTRAVDAQTIRAQAVRIQADVVKQAQRAMERVANRQSDWTASKRDKADMRAMADEQKLVLSKAKKDADDATGLYF
ncbi:hypothetical protein CLOM_g10667, partial [Closterium sp. NIES-68]